MAKPVEFRGRGLRSGAHPSNAELADALERIADLLEAQRGDVHRVRAYRAAAATARSADSSLAAILADGGRKGLMQLPGIGRSIAALVDECAHTGRIGLLERLEGQVSPEDLFTTVPGIGEELARRIHRELGIETLEELEIAAHDGQLEGVSGIGPRRARGIRESVTSILGRSSRRHSRRRRWLEAAGERARAQEGAAPRRPPIATLLAVDAEYRRRAAAGELHTVRPRRFNPERRAWLPVLHTERSGWVFSAFFSNTARAHDLGMTNDWVVLYFERDGDEDQCTVVTERRGPNAGRRVVRGLEAACTRHYHERGARSTDVPAARPEPG